MSPPAAAIIAVYHHFCGVGGVGWLNIFRHHHTQRVLVVVGQHIEGVALAVGTCPAFNLIIAGL